MERIYVKKDSNYTVISNEFIKNRSLSLRAKGLLTLILSLPDDWDFTIQGLIKICTEGRDVVRGSVNELIQMGHCSRVSKPRIGGKFIGYDYCFYESSQNQLITPCTEKPDTVSPDTVNQPQLSTKGIKYKRIKNNIIPLNFEIFYSQYKNKMFSDEEFILSLEKETDKDKEWLNNLIDEMIRKNIILKKKPSFEKFKDHFFNKASQDSKNKNENTGNAGRAMSL